MISEQLLASKGGGALAYNLGPSDEETWSVERIANKLAEMWGLGASWRTDPDPGVHEAHYLRLDSSRARLQLGWKPRLKIEAALEWTMAWYSAWNRGENMAEFTEKQIVDYENLSPDGK
jgi:CDP-glucose 4,6-dehydratase